MIRRCAISSVWLVLLLGSTRTHAGGTAPDKVASKQALMALQNYVGDWKGAGASKGGGKEAWTEESVWAWDFKSGQAALSFTTTQGKYYAAGRIEAGEKEGTYVFTGTLPDGKTTEVLKGNAHKDEVVLVNENPAAGRPAKLELTLFAKGKRLVLTLYAKDAAGKNFTPLAEVGFTRKGSGFGKDAQGPECVVTGGLGTSTVSYKGKTYYVCCSGCRDEFNANPEPILAEFAERKKKEKEASK